MSLFVSLFYRYYSGDDLQVIIQILVETEFDPESVRAVLEALKDAIKLGACRT